jgi:hypothetical protein
MNVKLTKINHFLSKSLEMTEMELAQITDKDLSEYRVLYATIPSDFESDRDEARKLQVKAESIAEELYGSYSNQYKYIVRNWHKGLDIVGSHYGSLESPTNLECRVQDAKVAQEI